jgi:hypothetical protein
MLYKRKKLSITFGKLEDDDEASVLWGPDNGILYLGQ